MGSETLKLKPIEVSPFVDPFTPLTVNPHKNYYNPFTGSKFVFGKTDDGQRVVLKESGNKEGLLREWTGLSKVLVTGLAVQEGMMIGELDDGTRVLVSKEVEGKSLADAPGEAKRRNVGKLLARIHQSVQISETEWKKSGRQEFRYYTWHLDFWRKRAEEIDPQTRRSITLADTLADQAANYFQDAKPVFTHQDLHDEQIIVTPQDTEVMIDFENWKESDPLDDLATYLFSLLRESSPLTYYDELSAGYFNDRKRTDLESTIVAFNLLFFALRAAGFFYTRKDNYFSTALNNLLIVTSYIEQEGLWK
jgi:Ser/Thr protein kinase RdoA (MazF antagonist)